MLCVASNVVIKTTYEYNIVYCLSLDKESSLSKQCENRDCIYLSTVATYIFCQRYVNQTLIVCIYFVNFEQTCNKLEYLKPEVVLNIFFIF